MSLAESPVPKGAIDHDVPAFKENEFTRTGVILVLASIDHRDKVKVCMITHTDNPLKGISYGDLGFPSETLEKAKEDESGEEGFEDPVRALLRCFREEVGIEDPSHYELFADPEDSFVHLFNLDTGMNGDSSNALGHGVVIWAPNQTRIIRSFQEAQTKGVIDRTEVAGIGFYDLDEVLSDRTSLQFRKAPHAPTIVRQLHREGKLNSPRL